MTWAAVRPQRSTAVAVPSQRKLDATPVLVSSVVLHVISHIHRAASQRGGLWSISGMVLESYILLHVKPSGDGSLTRRRISFDSS